MWEYCICFDNEIQAKIFVEKIFAFIKNNKGIVVNVFSCQNYKVLIAVPFEFKKRVAIFLCEKLAEIILTIYKKEYILKGLKFDKPKTTIMNVFLQTLFCFDSDIDKQIILERIKLNDKFYLGSFIDFRLKFLKCKWNELINLANDNIMYVINDESFLELIKFLISNLEHRVYAVNIFSKENCYLLCDIEGKVINDFLLDKNIVYDDGKLLTSLIALNPEKIILHCNNSLKDNLINNLYNLFSNRIEICK